MSGINGIPGGRRGQVWPSTGVGSRPAAIVRPEPFAMRAVAAAGFLLDAASRRRGGRMVAWALVIALAAGGAGLLGYPFATNVWAGRIQGRLGAEFKAMQTQSPQAFRRTIVEGDALTRLEIPRLRVKVIVVEGISGNGLRAGVGHYPSTALPGDPTGNIAIAGHRTGFGEPFRHLERMRQGDKIILTTPFGRFVYEVMGPFDGHSNPWITEPTDWSVISPTPEPSLTLTTCDPPRTTKNRLIVRAALVDKEMFG
ncbi:MAG: class E sortase [Actinomycetota bacterium]